MARRLPGPCHLLQLIAAGSTFLAILPPMALAETVPLWAPPDADAEDREVSPPAPKPGGQSSGQVVTVTLAEVIALAIQGNRDLRNDQLQRIVQRQELREAESRFDPRFTPELSVGVTQRLSGDNLLVLEEEEGVVADPTRTSIDESALVGATMTTRLGTELALGIDPLDGDQPFTFRITQPLLQGSGRAVNEAPVTQARLTEQQNQLALRQRLIGTITNTIKAYTDLIQAQELVAIQELALERRRRQYEILQALVAAGRRARVDLVDTERSIADAERDLIVASNSLAQTNTSLLNLIGTDAPLQFVASRETIQQLFETAVQRAANFQLEPLIEQAYVLQPDYLQALLAIEIQQQQVVVAENALEWSLDIQATGNVGDLSEGTLGIVATRTFDDPGLRTNLERSRVGVLQSENRLAQARETIRNEVTTRLGDVNSNLARVEAARRARASAEMQLEISQEKFQRGLGGVDIFQVISQEQTLVEAQNAELVAEIAFLNSVADLDQAVGLTLDSWSAVIGGSLD